jgi:2-dehydro-3-deoxygluconokinase
MVDRPGDRVAEETAGRIADRIADLIADRAIGDSGGSEVVTLGECLVALVAAELGPLAEATTFTRHVAGAEANVAVGLARLGHRPAFIGRVGADAFGTTVVRALRGAGVGVDWLAVDAGGPTGHLFRERRALGPAEVVYARNDSAGSRLGPRDVDAAAAAGAFDRARWLHLTGITPALSASCRSAVERAIDHARQRRLTVSLDLNLRRKLWSDEDARPVLADLAARSDVVLGSEDEAAVVAGLDESSQAESLLDGLLSLGPALAVLKRGHRGAIARARDGEPVTRPGLAVAAIDPVGAGDAFCAGFIAARLDGADVGRALEVGNACGAAAAATIGDQAGLPDSNELGRLLAASSRDAIR